MKKRYASYEKFLICNSKFILNYYTLLIFQFDIIKYLNNVIFLIYTQQISNSDKNNHMIGIQYMLKKLPKSML